MNKPEKVFRIGSVSASVFAREIENDNGKRTIRNVNLQRRYRDDEGEWKSTSSFSLAELPQAATVLQLATNYVAEKEAAVAG